MLTNTLIVVYKGYGHTTISHIGVISTSLLIIGSSLGCVGVSGFYINITNCGPLWNFAINTNVVHFGTVWACNFAGFVVHCLWMEWTDGPDQQFVVQRWSVDDEWTEHAETD